MIKNLNTPCPICGDELTPKLDAETSAWCVPCSQDEMGKQGSLNKSRSNNYNDYRARQVRRKDRPSAHN